MYIYIYTWHNIIYINSIYIYIPVPWWIYILDNDPVTLSMSPCELRLTRWTSSSAFLALRWPARLFGSAEPGLLLLPGTLGPYQGCQNEFSRERLLWFLGRFMDHQKMLRERLLWFWRFMDHQNMLRFSGMHQVTLECFKCWKRAA